MAGEGRSGHTSDQRGDAHLPKVAPGQDRACCVWSSASPEGPELLGVDKGQAGRRVLGSSDKGQLLQQDLILLAHLDWSSLVFVA